ncbi:MAG: M48 family metallopeptidase [Anaerolineaceae bacterium]
MPETTHNIIIAGKTIPYKIRISTRATRLRITVSASGVTVTLPKGVPQREAENFLKQNVVWLNTQLERTARLTKPSPLPADVILWHGEAVQLQRIEEADRKSRVKVEAAKGRLKVYMPAGSKASTRLAAEAWMRANARTEIEQVVIEQARRMNARPKAVSIRDQRTRWGSCSSRGNLAFNWRLVMTPPGVLEYVVVHELAHMFELNHSKDFWDIVARFFPEYKKARTWLRKNASSLRVE